MYTHTNLQVMVYILDRLVIQILAQLLSDKGQTLPIDADFVASLDEDIAEITQVQVVFSFLNRWYLILYAGEYV